MESLDSRKKMEKMIKRSSSTIGKSKPGDPI